MSKKVKRQCPACKKSKLFRSDQVTCGCKGNHPNASPKKSENPEAKAKKILLGKKVPLTTLAEKLGSSPEEAKYVVAKLMDSGHNVQITDNHIGIETAIEPGNRISVNSKDFFDGQWFKFGVLGDTHLYSRYARLDVLNCLYDLYEKEGINTVWHTGNIVDGECRFNKFDLVGPGGIGRQAEYLANNYPKRDGIVTKFITGEDHEGWWIQREGLNVGRYLEMAAQDAGRSDLEWIGHVEADISLKAPKGQAWMRVMHPGGGSAYAISYTEQKIVESFQGGEKPHILFAGHYHKFNQGYPREVHTVQTGCCQDQTPFLRRLKIQVHVGGTIVRYHQADTGEINRFGVEWIPFYDRRFYDKLDKYRRW